MLRGLMLKLERQENHHQIMRLDKAILYGIFPNQIQAVENKR